jgi:hypothetical protein
MSCNKNTGAELKILTVEEIEAETVKWLWEPYIALGKLLWSAATNRQTDKRTTDRIVR